MNKRTKTFVIISLCGLLLTLAAVVFLRVSQPANAHQDAIGYLEVNAYPDPADASSKALSHGIVMVSVIKNGEIVRQSENNIASVPLRWGIPVGAYDLRVEGQGMLTLVKRGIQITTGGNNVIRAPMRPGQGARVIEYATGGLSREEIAARLAKLETALAQLQKTQQAK